MYTYIKSEYKKNYEKIKHVKLNCDTTFGFYQFNLKACKMILSKMLVMFWQKEHIVAWERVCSLFSLSKQRVTQGSFKYPKEQIAYNFWESIEKLLNRNKYKLGILKSILVQHATQYIPYELS